MRRVLVALLPLSTACSLLYSLDGFEGGGASNPGADARHGESPDGVAPDAPAQDGSSSQDAAATEDVAPSDGGFCVPGALFCDDFEREGVQGPWTSSAASGGTLSLIKGTPTGRALAASVPVGDAGGSAALTKEIAVNATGVVAVRARIRLSGTPSSGGVQPIHLKFYDGAATTLVFPYIFFNGLTVAEVVCSGGCQYNQSSAVAFARGDWHDLVLTVDFRTPPAHYTIELDGQSVIDTKSVRGAKPGVLTVSSGIVVVDPVHEGFEVDLDDIVVTSM